MYIVHLKTLKLSSLYKKGPEEAMIRIPVSKYRSKIVKDLWKITEEYNTLHPTNWTEEVTQIILEYQARIIKEKKERNYDGSDIPKPKWTFTGALLYSIAVITTVGKNYYVLCNSTLFNCRKSLKETRP